MPGDDTAWECVQISACVYGWVARHCVTSDGAISLRLLTWAGSPVIAPFTTSAVRLKMFLAAREYVAEFILTRIMAIRGSFSEPSCFPSPRSPTQAFSSGL